MRWIWPWLVLVVALAGTLAGCSGFSSESSSSAFDEVEELKVRVLELQRQAAIDQVEIGRLGSRLDELEATLRLSSVAPGNPDPAEPQGIAEEKIDPISPPASIEVTDLDDEPAGRLPADEQQRADISRGGLTLYDRGYTYYHQERYRDAEDVLFRFLQENRASELADNALYWIGESRVARGELQPALAAFRQVLRDYPASNKAPDALFKIGTVLEALGDIGGARKSYSELLSSYPGSSISSEARILLELPRKEQP